jgi:hypothetical protein
LELPDFFAELFRDPRCDAFVLLDFLLLLDFLALDDLLLLLDLEPVDFFALADFFALFLAVGILISPRITGKRSAHQGLRHSMRACHWSWRSQADSTPV